ncbi:MAG: PT domain-containing protein [Clostridia bacterium]|nr:PT domain-containing protein [Clostridia bacterium]
MKNVLRIMMLPVCLAILAGLAACKPGDDGGNNTQTAVPTAAELVTAAPTSAPTEQATEVPTDAPTEAPKPPVEAGMMVYYEDFSGYGDIDDTYKTARALGWEILSVAVDHAKNDWTAQLAIKDGALHVTNYSEEKGTGGTDGYTRIFDEMTMKRVKEFGSYTLQYDVTYLSASNYKRYINFITEYDAEGYNSYHFRIGGYGNNQTWYQGTWYTLDANDGNDLYAAKKKNDDNGTTVAYKLLGIEEPMDENTHNNFANVTVTIRVVRVDGLATIYMKTADMSEFLKVSAPSEASEDRGIEKSLYGLGVCFKVGGGINGIVDNVAIWTGTGEMPADKTVTYVP